MYHFLYHLFWGFPPLTVLFLAVWIVDTTANYCSLKRQQVPGIFIFRVLLFRSYLGWLPWLPASWLVSTADRHGHISQVSPALIFLGLALAHNTLLRPVYRKYRQAVLDRTAYQIWG